MLPTPRRLRVIAALAAATCGFPAAALVPAASGDPASAPRPCARRAPLPLPRVVSRLMAIVARARRRAALRARIRAPAARRRRGIVAARALPAAALAGRDRRRRRRLRRAGRGAGRRPARRRAAAAGLHARVRAAARAPADAAAGVRRRARGGARPGAVRDVADPAGGRADAAPAAWAATSRLARSCAGVPARRRRARVRDRRPVRPQRGADQGRRRRLDDGVVHALLDWHVLALVVVGALALERSQASLRAGSLGTARRRPDGFRRHHEPGDRRARVRRAPAREPARPRCRARGLALALAGIAPLAHAGSPRSSTFSRLAAVGIVAPASADAVAHGQVWLLLTSGLAAQAGAAAGRITAAVAVCVRLGAAAWWRAALAGHVLSAPIGTR